MLKASLKLVKSKYSLLVLKYSSTFSVIFVVRKTTPRFLFINSQSPQYFLQFLQKRRCFLNNELSIKKYEICFKSVFFFIGYNRKTRVCRKGKLCKDDISALIHFNSTFHLSTKFFWRFSGV